MAGIQGTRTFPTSLKLLVGWYQVTAKMWIRQLHEEIPLPWLDNLDPLLAQQDIHHGNARLFARYPYTSDEYWFNLGYCFHGLVVAKYFQLCLLLLATPWEWIC